MTVRRDCMRAKTIIEVDDSEFMYRWKDREMKFLKEEMWYWFLMKIKERFILTEDKNVNSK